MKRFLMTTLLVLLATTGCASAGSSEGSSRNPDVITSEELRGTQIQSETAYNAIQRLRPAWLRARGSSFTGGRQLPSVFVDGTRYGEIDALRSLNVSEIAEIEYLDSRDATTRFGTGYPAGAIMVTTG
ncbi:MAG: hypothetical protein R3223_02275 [Longimicrobiales bacterium]|nr:hypothetical protein [Longimicrobiales bacterium]